MTEHDGHALKPFASGVHLLGTTLSQWCVKVSYARTLHIALTVPVLITAHCGSDEPESDL